MVLDSPGPPVAAIARLRQLADEIAQADTRIPTQALAAGGALTEAKQLIGRGGFVDWYESACAIDRNAVRRLLLVAKCFSQIPVAQIEQFDTSALFVLSEKRCRPEARTQAIEESARGLPITYTRARELRDAASPPKLRLPRRVPQLDSERGESTKAAAPTPQHRAWMNLEELVQRSTMIHLSREADDNDGETVLAGRAFPDDDNLPPRAVVRRSLAGVIGYLAGNEQRKTCCACRKEKTADEFAQNETTPDGRNYRCLVCERKRLAKVKEQQ